MSMIYSRWIIIINNGCSLFISHNRCFACKTWLATRTTEKKHTLTHTQRRTTSYPKKSIDINRLLVMKKKKIQFVNKYFYLLNFENYSLDQICFHFLLFINKQIDVFSLYLFKHFSALVNSDCWTHVQMRRWNRNKRQKSWGRPHFKLIY